MMFSDTVTQRYKNIDQFSSLVLKKALKLVVRYLGLQYRRPAFKSQLNKII